MRHFKGIISNNPYEVLKWRNLFMSNNNTVVFGLMTVSVFIFVFKLFIDWFALREQHSKTQGKLICLF